MHISTLKNNALLYAAEQGYLDIVILLLKYGADINAQNTDSDTALMYAMENGNKEMITLLTTFDAIIENA